MISILLLSFSMSALLLLIATPLLLTEGFVGCYGIIGIIYNMSQLGLMYYMLYKVVLGVIEFIVQSYNYLRSEFHGIPQKIIK